jgi:hypothetical protein
MLIWIYSGHLEYFTTIGNILRTFDNFVIIWYIFPTLVYCSKKNLATLAQVFLQILIYGIRLLSAEKEKT